MEFLQQAAKIPSVCVNQVKYVCMDSHKYIYTVHGDYIPSAFSDGSKVHKA